MTIAQLDATELHKAAAYGGTPAMFTDANVTVEETRRAYRAAVATRHELVREARAVRVPYLALERWTGLSARTLHDIVNAGN